MSAQEKTAPNLSQQLGLRDDPNKLDHTVSHTGSRVTRFETGQPGFPTYHRRIANPVPLICICIGAFFLLYGFLLVEVRGLTNWHIILNIGLPLCGPGLMAGAMFSFAEGNTFLATFAGSLSGILAGYSLTFLPWAGIEGAYTMEGPYPQPSYANADLNQADGGKYQAVRGDDTTTLKIQFLIVSMSLLTIIPHSALAHRNGPTLRAVPRLSADGRSHLRGNPLYHPGIHPTRCQPSLQPEPRHPIRVWRILHHWRHLLLVYRVGSLVAGRGCQDLACVPIAKGGLMCWH